MSGFFMDLTNFQSGLEKFAGTAMPDLVRKGIFAATAELIHDANTVPPKTPRREGHLRGSSRPGGGGDPIINKTIAGEEVICGFNIEYASFVHEMVREEKWGEKGIRWTEPDSGAKFLESKLTMFGNKYLKLIAAVVSAGGFR
jgi:hypothetical protein